MTPQEKAAETRRRNRARRLASVEIAFAAAGHDFDTAMTVGNRRVAARMREALRKLGRERHSLRWSS